MNASGNDEEDFDKFAEEYDAIQKRNLGALTKDLNSLARYKVELAKRFIDMTPNSIRAAFSVRFALCFVRLSHEYSTIFASKVGLAQHKTDEKSTQSEFVNRL